MKIKICGITREEDAVDAIEAGADALGFIFVRDSPRNVTSSFVASIVRNLPPFVVPTGVFVNATRDEVLRTIDNSGIRCVQFHGDEKPEELEGIPVPVIKSFRIGAGFDTETIRQFPASAYLLDTLVPGSYGGTGRSFDWDVAVRAKLFGRIILSGGLTENNVRDAVQNVRPYAVDVSSGVERKPGVKDRDRIARFVEAARQASGVFGGTHMEQRWRTDADSDETTRFR